MSSESDFSLNDLCVIIPTFNNAGTIVKVIEDILFYTKNIIVVNDGSNDDTLCLLADIKSIFVISYEKNHGKGYALKKGFKKAIESGFRYALTIDSDGQHFASDIPAFISMIKEFPDSLIIGSRFLEQENMPSKNSFANKFSNFWFQLQTSQKLPDTQSGFRLYPLNKIKKIHLFSNRYESELEILVRCAWNFIPVKTVPISVYYPPEDQRISHFRPGIDFFRISILNTIFTFLALFYYYPKVFFISTFRIIHRAFRFNR